MDYGAIEAIVAHEYFHNWTGNRITCRDWFQLCLKEGLTVFRDQEFTSDERSRPVERIKDVRGLRAHQFVEDAGPLAHPVRPTLYREINNFYTATVYEKGAEVVRMLGVRSARRTFRKEAWTSTSRATTARRRRSNSSCSASPTPRASTSSSSCCGTRRPAPPEVVVTGNARSAPADLPARRRPDAAADAGPAQQGADGDPAGDRPCGDGRPRPTAAAGWRPRGRARAPDAERAGQRASSSPASRRARAVAQPRLLGTGEARRQYRRQGSALPRRPR